MIAISMCDAFPEKEEGRMKRNEGLLIVILSDENNENQHSFSSNQASFMSTWLCIVTCRGEIQRSNTRTHAHTNRQTEKKKTQTDPQTQQGL